MSDVSETYERDYEVPYPLPRCLESEQSVLGSILIENKALDRAMGEMQPEAMNLDCHHQILQAMLAMRNQGRLIDLNTLPAELEERGRLESVGGLGYLTNLMDAPSSFENIEWFAKRVENAYNLRLEIDAFTRLREACYCQGADADEILSNADSIIQQIRSMRAGKPVPGLREIVDERLTALEDRYANKGITGHRTPYDEYNFLTSGLHPDELTIIAGRPGLGKSSLMMQLAMHHAEKHGPVAIFSLEMSTQQLVDRLFSTGARVDSHHVRTGMMHSDDWQRVGEFACELQAMPMFIDDSAAMSIHELRAKARKLHTKTPLSLICVDYLQLLTSGKNQSNRVAELGEVSRGLAALKKELHIPVIALAQLSREVEKRGDRAPQLSDIRECGQIEQDADVVSFLYRDKKHSEESRGEEAPDIISWVIAKQRNGPTGTAELNWTGRFTRFDDITKNYDQDNRLPYNEN